MSKNKGKKDHKDFENTEREGADRMQLREEQLDVRKRATQTGEVRLGKEVVTEEKNFTVPVAREEVVIERHSAGNRPSDRPIGEGDDQTLRVPVLEEQVSVSKRPVVTEEVSIGKQAVQDNRQVNETLRREEARLQSEGDVNINRTGADFDQSQPDA